MQKNNSRIKYILFALSLLCAIFGMISVTLLNSGQDYIDKLDNKYNPEGAAVVIISNGKIQDVRDFGYANVANKIKVTDETQFKIASISKTITAYAVMKLVDEGKLDLDTPVNSYLTKWTFPNTKFDESQVTLRTLMSHTSGITGSDEYGYKEPLPTIEEVLKIRNIKLKREPGEIFEYSEFAGFAICQLVIEEVTGTKFEDYMVNKVFKPLGMNHTSYENSSERLATPYAGTGKPINITPIVMNGGGGVTTTAIDLARFEIELMNYYNNGNKDMFKAQQNTQSVGGMYALGIIPRELKSGKIVYEHNGTLTGWNAQIAFEPISKNGMVILTNSDKSYYMTYDLMGKWSEKVVGGKVIDTFMIQIVNKVLAVITILFIILLSLIIVFVFQLKRGKIILTPASKIKRMMLIIILAILVILYYIFLYTEIPFKLLFHMDNYYLFSFLPLDLKTVNVLLAMIAFFLAFRRGFVRKITNR